MTVEIEATPAQALALQTMFEHWNRFGSWGSSRDVAFFVDGDGNFKPRAKWSYSQPVPELTDEMRKACTEEFPSGDLRIDFDPIAWMLRV